MFIFLQPSDCASLSDSTESEADVSIPLSEVNDLKTELDEIEKMRCRDPECADTPCDNELHVKPDITPW